MMPFACSKAVGSTGSLISNDTSAGDTLLSIILEEDIIRLVAVVWSVLVVDWRMEKWKCRCEIAKKNGRDKEQLKEESIGQ
mmetsp:Transcript_18608/g.22335  ORF Transcript_18608/g.22335 Transcript_18608/m.22335 type:complete len:81 (+) Transcript_18608:163-405(+)